jgi:alpha-ketoglutarate-dependent taurine dioxygenase
MLMITTTRSGDTEAEVEARRVEFPPQRHPVVRTPPVGDNKSIYVIRAFARCIEGMERVTIVGDRPR